MLNEKKTGVLFFLCWSILLICITVVAGYNGLYGQDSHEYLRYCMSLAGHLKGGDHPGDFFWPVNYPLLGAIVSFLTGPGMALQLISILSASWIIYLITMFLMYEFPGREKEVILYVLLFMGSAPYFFRYSISSMSDIPAMAFACSAYYAIYLSFRKDKEYLIYFTWGLAAMAILTRFALLPLVTPAILYSGVLMVKRFRVFPYLLAVALAMVPLVIFYYFKQENTGNIFRHYLVGDWSVINYFRNSFNTPDGISVFHLPNLLFAFSFLVHPGFLFPGILFLFVFVARRNKPSLLFPLVISGVLLYIGFIAGIPAQNARYLVPVLPFYIVACFPAFLSVLAWFYNREQLKVVVVMAVFIIQVTLTYRAFLPFYQLNKIEKNIADKIIGYHPTVLYTFGIDGALGSYGYNGTIINLWDKQLDSLKAGALLLFNKQQYANQWQGKNPMKNYFFIVDVAGAGKLEELESGWEIYEIKEAYPYTHPGVPAVR